jgi:hypothetical protein
MGIKYFFLISVSIVLVWGIALAVGACSQLKQAISNLKNGSETPIEPNRVLTGTLKALGLSRKDRLACSLWIFNALMLWPITLIVAIPLINALRSQERREANQLLHTQQPAIRAESTSTLVDVPSVHSNANQAVPS